jgi:uncharacterized protein (DUF2267 family)
MQQLIDRVKARMGNASDGEAARALEATLMTLGERMPPKDADMFSGELAPRWVEVIRRYTYDPGLAAIDEFYKRVARREGQPLSAAREHAQAVCRALLDILGARESQMLRASVWPDLLYPSLEDRFAPHMPGHGPALATGRPGSRHPLSEARPPDRAHRESVVHAENPHGARKLSSGAPRGRQP